MGISNRELIYRNAILSSLKGMALFPIDNLLGIRREINIHPDILTPISKIPNANDKNTPFDYRLCFITPLTPVVSMVDEHVCFNDLEFSNVELRFSRGIMIKGDAFRDTVYCWGFDNVNLKKLFDIDKLYWERDNKLHPSFNWDRVRYRYW